MISKDTIRQDRSALISALEQAGTKFRGNTCCCPFHDDHRPSAGVYQGKDGVWRFKCQSCGVGGDIYDIKAKLSGSTPAQAIRESLGIKQNTTTFAFPNVQAVKAHLETRAGKITGEYQYGEDFTIYRCEIDGIKTYRPVYLTDRGYCLTSPPKPWSLYNLQSLKDAEAVIVCEGEKCSDALIQYGFTATTSAHGAKSAKNSDWSPLAGKQVILWPDNDLDGKRYMADVQQILQELHPPARISILNPADAELTDEGEDVADFVSQEKNVFHKQPPEITCALSQALKKAKVVSVSTEVRQRFADISAGLYRAIDWPFDGITALTRALLPGTVTLIVGNPGASKSFMTLQAFSFWIEAGLKCSLYEVEEDRTFHLTRALAQRSGEGNLTDTTWVKQNTELSDQIITENQEFIDSFGRVIYASPDIQPTLAQLAEWVEAKAKSGSRIIGIDPITAAEREGDAWVVDGRFLQAVKRTATDYGCSIILVTHPVKAVSFPDLSQISGSAAYQRFSQTILWLESHDEKESNVKTTCGTAPTIYNRTLHILKARNGRGMGLRLAYQFDARRLTLAELGSIMREKK
jgi:5S rRNA maturation endonuclease (ribonuclease M5)